MIDGVMAANEHSTRSAAVRDRLWSAATPLLSEEQPAPVASVTSARRDEALAPPARRAA
jgi:hypothetical protein